ncbi:MAG: mechanosensitive ion channel family protein [Planctomycetaceae bacterium]
MNKKNDAMRKRFIFSLVLTLLITSGSVLLHAQTTPGSNEQGLSDSETGASASTPEDKEIELRPDIPDEQITEKITNILESTGWYEDLKVRSDEGVVFLSGRAIDEDKQAKAEIISQNVKHVVAVVSDLELQDSSGLQLDNATSHILKSLDGLWRDFLERSPLILVGLLILLATWGVERIARVIVVRSAQKARFRSSLRDLFAQLTTFSTWVLGIMVAAIVVFPGMTPAKLLTLLGLGSVALGFAFKDIFENFFAGILILWRFPFDRGDFIECGDIAGKVEDITIRMTTIRQVDGQLVVVPNSVLFKNSVNILTNRDLRRTTIICGVAYDEDVDECRGIIETAVRDCTTVATSEPVEIFAQEFASSSINYEVTWWTGSEPVDIRRSRDEVVAAVKRSFDEAGIEIPFPYRTLTFKQPLSVTGEINDLVTNETENHS